MQRFVVWSLYTLAVACAPQGAKVEDEVEGHYLRGQDAYLGGRFDDALKEYNEVAKLAPDHPRLSSARGDVFLALGKFREAVSDFERVTQQDPRRATGWSRLGFALVQARDPRAKEALEKALTLSPNDALAHEMLGDLSKKAKSWPEAAEHYRLASQVQTLAAERARLGLQAAEAWRAGGNTAALLDFVKSEQTGHHASSEILSLAGEVLLARGELGPAAEAYRAAAVASKRGDPGLWEVAGELELRRGNTQRAAEAFEESLHVRETTTVHVALMRLALQKGDKAAAKEALDRALAVANGSDPREVKELADGLARMGRKPDAFQLLSQLASEPPMAADVALQTRTALLAAELKDDGVRRLACARLEDAKAARPDVCR